MGGIKGLLLLFLFISAPWSFAKGLAECEKLLRPKFRYEMDLSRLPATPDSKIPVLFHMTDHSTLTPKVPADAKPMRMIEQPDVTIVGGGPAGLTAALYAAKAGKKVVILERNERPGGLGMGNRLQGIDAGGGAAYSVGPETPEELEVFRDIGMEDFQTRIAIKEPIDSYLWNGVLYEGIWEEHTLEKLPASFALFKHVMKGLIARGVTKDGLLARWADNLMMDELVHKMPEILESWGDPESQHLLARYKGDAKVPSFEPMRDVINLLDLYGRSALGGTAQEINARIFVDFYISEMETRYTGTWGTGTVTKAIVDALKNYSHLVEIRTSAPVAKIENRDDGVLTTFVEDGVVKEIFSSDMIYAAPVTLAPKLIKDLEQLDPEKVKAIKEVKNTDYAVYVVRVKGHPFRATYDTWVYSGGDLTKATDYILGRWQDPNIRAYEGMRNFERDPDDDYGVISIYKPLGDSDQAHFDVQNNLRDIEMAVEDMKRHLGPLAALHGQKIEVELVEAYRWPDSIHKVGRGSLRRFPLLERSVGRIHFANNTIGAPELEPAMAHAAKVARAVAALRTKKSENLKKAR